jgi:hypothetical protein
MTLAQLRDFLQLRRQRRERTGTPKSLDRAQLLVRGAARANEIRMVGIRKSIRTGASRRQDGALLEDEHGAARSGKRQDSFDRVDAFRIGDDVATAVGDAEADAFLCRETRDEVGALRLGGAQLEVRRARSAEGCTAEERPAQVRTAAAGTCDDAARRCEQRSEPGAQDTGFVEDLEGALVPGDVELIARRAAECTAPVRADLRCDSECAQQAERASRDGRVGHVEMDGNLTAAPEVDAARRVEEPGELGQPIAFAPRRDRGELVAEILRE